MPSRYAGSSRRRLRSITAPSLRVLADQRAHVGHPTLGIAVCLRCRVTSGAALRTGKRVRAEELHLLLLRAEVAEAVGDDLVGDVALEVDEEAVVAEVALGGSR